MITMLVYSHIKKEVKALTDAGNDIACKISDEDWDFLSCNEKSYMQEILQKQSVIDISCVDVAAENGIDFAEHLRESNRNMSIILLTNPEISPMMYIRPTIMASSLLVRPLTSAVVKKVFFETIRSYLDRFYSNNNAESFVINNRDGRQLVPYNSIRFFESRNKKIYVSTATEEYSFYDTLDNLEKTLSDDFVRCHRSFIVSKKYIKNIKLSKSLIVLDTDCLIPLSRSYKSMLKEISR